MKKRLSLTIDPKVLRRARRMAHARRTSISRLVEDYFRKLEADTDREENDFVERWCGRFSLAPTVESEERGRALIERYKLGRG